MATTQAAPKKKGFINFDFLQKLGKVLMTVIAVMPAAGLMISLGKLVQMGGGDIAAVMTIGTTMENIGWAVINNLHILFAVAIGGSWAKERAGGAFAAVLAFALINVITGNIFGVTSAMLADPDAVTHTLFGQEIAVNGYFTSVLGAPALNMGVFVGIIAGFVGGVAYNKYYNFRKLPDALAFFNGKRFVPMVVIAYSVVISLVLALFWPVVQTGINNFGIWIANSSETSPVLAPFIYGTLERLLLPVVREGDMVADLCCGSGTAMEAAQSLGCRFVGVDKSPEAILTTASRLECSDLTIDCPCTMDETPLEGEYNGHGGMLLLTGFHAAHPSFPKTEQQLDTLESWSVGKITPEGLQVMQRFRRSRKQPELPWFCVLPEGCGDIAVSTVDAAGRKRVYRWKD